MFVHDHAEGITRLNVYAGEAMGYLLTDQVEQDLINQGVLPDLGTPLIIQDKTFIDPNTVLTTDPTWPLPVDQSGSTSNLWTPHVYIPNQNPNGPDGTNPMGRWDYGPFFWPPWPTTEAPIQGVGNIHVQQGGSNYTNRPDRHVRAIRGRYHWLRRHGDGHPQQGHSVRHPRDGERCGLHRAARRDHLGGTVGGTQAVARAILDANGAVIGYKIVNPGSGYRRYRR